MFVYFVQPFCLCSLGNHESERLNTMYGFEGEVKAKYSNLMMDLFSELFNWLPLAHCIEGKILVRMNGLMGTETSAGVYW